MHGNSVNSIDLLTRFRFQLGCRLPGRFISENRQEKCQITVLLSGTKRAAAASSCLGVEWAKSPFPGKKVWASVVMKLSTLLSINLAAQTSKAVLRR